MSHNLNLHNLKDIEKIARVCVLCGLCREPMLLRSGITYICPIYQIEKYHFEAYTARGKNIIVQDLLNGEQSLDKEIRDILFRCTLCGACDTFCHNSFSEDIEYPISKYIENVKVFEALRADLTKAGLALPSHSEMNTYIKNLFNPYNKNPIEKDKWISYLTNYKKIINNRDSSLLYFVGCTAALNPQTQIIAINTATILDKLGINYRVFGKDEICCGSVAKRTGDLETFNRIMEKNLMNFKLEKINTIITSCAGCYRTFKKDYGDKLYGIEIMHTMEYLDKIINEKDVKLKNLNIKTVYHDPCHLGRHMEGNLYELPRKILNKISEVVEFTANKDGSHCCGAGGGLKKGFPDLAIQIAERRIQEAEDTEAQYLVSSCPFCNRNLSEAIEKLNSHLKMVDITELILKSLN